VSESRLCHLYWPVAFVFGVACAHVPQVTSFCGSAVCTDFHPPAPLPMTGLFPLPGFLRSLRPSLAVSPPSIVISQRFIPCEFPVAWKISGVLTRSVDFLDYFICKCHQFQH
jgi:hypothetical protein